MSMPVLVTPASVVRAGERHVSTVLSGEAVILELDSGTYFGLNDVATRVWGLLSEPRTVGEIRDAIASEYDVSTEECEADVIALISQLVRGGLVEVLPSVP